MQSLQRRVLYVRTQVLVWVKQYLVYYKYLYPTLDYNQFPSVATTQKT